MATAVLLPKLDEAMTKGRIVKWMKQDGEQVKKGEALLEVETEKVTFEIEAEESGILKIVVGEGEEVPIKTVVAYILQPGEKAPEAPKAPEPVAAVKKEAAVEASTVAVSVEVPETLERAGGRIKASPSAKKIAREHNINLAVVRATGPGGRIVRADVLRAVEEGKVGAAQPVREELALAEEEITSLSSMREVIACHMIESFQTPHFYLTVEVDGQELVKTRTQLIPLIESKVGIRLTITDLLIKIVAKALEDNPSVNCAYADGSVKLFRRIDIGLVTSVEGGLIVPIIRRANKMSLAEISQDRAELAQRARDGKLSLGEMRGSTFTISNMGMFGVDQISAILQPPEAAILAVGRLADKAVVRDGQVVIRPIMTMTLSIDHRVLDGVIGAQFLQSLKNYIESPVSVIV